MTSRHRLSVLPVILLRPTLGFATEITGQEDFDALQSEMPGLSPRGPPTLSPLAQEDVAPSAHPILGNRKSGIYHRPDCPNYSQIAIRNRVTFKTAAEAEEAGYRQAKNCP